MSLSLPVAIPSSRALVGWWRQLCDLDPPLAKPSGDHIAFWVAQLDVDRLEALSRVSHTVSVDPFTQLVLNAVAKDVPCRIPHLQQIVPVNPAVLRQALLQLQEDGLVTRTANESIALTEEGSSATRNGKYNPSVFERRAFHFRWSARPDQPPQFLPLKGSGEPLPTSSDSAVGVEHLLNCVQQSAEWKSRHGFPTEVAEILLPVAGDTTVNAWKRIVCRQSERIALVLIRHGGLRGYAVHRQSLALDLASPALEMRSSWEEIIPELNHEPLIEQWKLAWREWLGANGVSSAGADTHHVERRGHRLRIRVAKPLLERIRHARDDPLRHAAWILAGDERIRAAAPLEIVTA